MTDIYYSHDDPWCSYKTASWVRLCKSQPDISCVKSFIYYSTLFIYHFSHNTVECFTVNRKEERWQKIEIRNAILKSHNAIT